MDVSIIIINYNTKKITANCIQSIIENTYEVEYEIILIDNGSTDGSAELFEADTRIKYIYSKENIGFGKANNLGHKHALGKYLFLLNSDTILLNNVVYLFYKYAEKTKDNWGVLGCQLYTKEMNYSPSFGYFLSIKRELKNALMSYVRQFYRCDNVAYVEVDKTVEVVIGADLFLRKSTADIYGLFDPIYFMYHEENDMQKHYYKHGLKQRIISGPKIVHLESQSTKISFKKVEMCTMSTFLYLKKWNRRLPYLYFRCIYFFLRIPYVFKLKYVDRVTYIKLLLRRI